MKKISSKISKNSPKIDKQIYKKEGEDLQQFLAFRRRDFKIPAKKGKGSYNRNKFKSEV